VSRGKSTVTYGKDEWWGVGCERNGRGGVDLKKKMRAGSKGSKESSGSWGMGSRAEVGKRRAQE
jgi:hypothetical protein